MQVTNLTLFTGSLLLAAVVAAAHNGATGVVLERMNGMTAMRDVISELSPMVQGTVPYDPAIVSAGASTIAEHAGDTLLGLFPEGSIEGVTYAKPEIWSDWKTFEDLANQLLSYSSALAEAAPNGLAPAMPMDMDMNMGSGSMDMPMIAVPPVPSERSFSVAELLGYGRPTQIEAAPESGAVVDLAVLPVADLFEGVSAACSSCHAKFRAGRN